MDVIAHRLVQHHAGRIDRVASVAELTRRQSSHADIILGTMMHQALVANTAQAEGRSFVNSNSKVVDAQAQQALMTLCQFSLLADSRLSSLT